ncbi:MAG: hypothetical protein VB055_06195 [Oscillospiraceae bacterium]|nr:hypothetical protein [Oscillospiraceae bacterium]
MWWYYKLLEGSNRIKIYQYSRENKDLDGLIRFDSESGVKIMKPSAIDKESIWLQQKAVEHFYTVIAENFPDEREICCG